jgi:hypothetical protein
MAEPGNFILMHLGKILHGYADSAAREPLPRRWVELINHLNDREREEVARSKAGRAPDRKH